MAAEKIPAGITKNPSGTYSTRPFDATLGKKTRQRTFDSLEEAIAYKAAIEAKTVDPAKTGWTVARWAEEWTTSPGFKRPKESTNIHNASQIKQFVETHGDKLMTEISRQIARKYTEEHPSQLGAIRAMFSDAVSDEIISRNPFTQLRTSKGTGRKHHDVPTEKEVQQLIAIAYEKWDDWPFYGSYIACAAYTGMRIGELLAIRWDDINFKEATIHVHRQWNSKVRDYTPLKNERPRTIELLEPAHQALSILPKDGPDGLVWRSPQGKRIEPNLHFYYWAQVRERWFGTLPQDRYTKLREMDFHTLRHFHASWLVDLGIPPADVAAQLGHTDGGYLIQTLYGHLYPESSRARIRKAFNEARKAA